MLSLKLNVKIWITPYSMWIPTPFLYVYLTITSNVKGNFSFTLEDITCVRSYARRVSVNETRVRAYWLA